MENKVLDAVIARIRKIDSANTPIFLDEVKQDFIPPAFFIRVLNVTQTAEMNNRYRRRYSLDIEYHANTDRRLNEAYNVKRELAEVADALLFQMEFVKLESGLIRGSDISYEVQDNVLHFYISFSFFVWKVEDKEEYMMSLEQRQKTKG